MKSKLIATSVSLLALLSATGYAQTAPATTPAADSGDIVVTATRDKTLLSKTPIALVAISGDTLRDKGVVTPTALGDQVAGLSIDRTNGLQITIRGITSTDGTEKGNPSAAFMIDGVYIARPQEADISFFDVHDVEVLKGPQGTLYGRNTTAGVINVITNRPEFNKLSAAGNASYGNYNSYTVDGFVNLPAADWAAFRLAASLDSRDSFVTGVAGDNVFNKNFRTNATFRGQGLFKLGSNGDLLIRGAYSQLNGSRDSAVPVSNYYSSAHDFSSSAHTDYVDPNTGIADPNHYYAYVSTWKGVGSSGLVQPNAMPSFTTVDANGSSVHGYGGGNQNSTKIGVNDVAYNLDAELNYNFGPAKMTYIGSLRQYTAHENTYCCGGQPATFDGDYTQQSHELRVATSHAGPLKLQGGLYYFREESRIAFYIYDLVPAVFGNTYIYGFPQHTISATKGAYAQGTYEVMPHLRLTAGARYTSDDLNRYGHTVHENSLAGTPLAGGFYTLDPAAGHGRSYVNDGDIVSKKMTWRVGFEADVNKGLVYGSIATGYKEGGFGDGCSTGLAGQSLVSSQGERCDAVTLTNPALPLQPNPKAANYNPLKYGDQQAIYYQPETVTDYEIGYRGPVAKGIKIDTNIFYYDYQNLQLSAIIPVNGALQTVTTNAGKASILGWEFQTSLNPNKDLEVQLGANITDGHYVQFCPSGLLNGVCGANSNGQLANYAGQKLDRTPNAVFTAGVNYTIPMGDAKVVASVATRATSSYSVTVFGDNGSYWQKFWTPAQTKTQASLTYYAAHKAYNVGVFVKNIEDKVALVTVGGGNVTMTDPRTYGIRAGFKF
jgi:iron complex outermembrane recepter protein